MVNRGEPAVRLIRAVRQPNDERGHQIKVVSLHTGGEQREARLRLEWAEIRPCLSGAVAREISRASADPRSAVVN